MTELISNHEKLLETESQETKKFVFQIYDENINFIESISAENKNILVNRLLYNYQFKVNKNKKDLEQINFWKKTAITALITIISIPLFIMLVNFSFDITINSYSKMERNFSKLFK